MSDIVERLREASVERQQIAWGRIDGGQECSIAAILADQAADEIERLRARVAELEPIGSEAAEIRRKWGIESDESLTECVERNIDGWKQRALKAEAAQEWRTIESAPKTPNDSTRAIELLGWCPDETSPIGGDRRTIWWEPRLRGGCWYSDRDLVEHPTMWTDLPAPPKEGI